MLMGAAPFMWLIVRHDRWVRSEDFRPDEETRRAEAIVSAVGFLVIWGIQWVAAFMAGSAVLMLVLDLLDKSHGLIEKIGWQYFTDTPFILYYLGGLYLFIGCWRVTEAAK